MRILVQDAVRRVFFDGVNWNNDAALAREFESVTQAESFCEQHQLSTALIVVKSQDERRDISYPVGVRHAVLVSRPAGTQIRRLC